MDPIVDRLLWTLATVVATGFTAWAVLGKKQAYLEGQLSMLQAMVKDVPAKLGGIETRLAVAESDLNHLHQRVREISTRRSATSGGASERAEA